MTYDIQNNQKIEYKLTNNIESMSIGLLGIYKQLQSFILN